LFLHVDRTCNPEDPFCNCGASERFMDANETDGFSCDGQGCRAAGPTVGACTFTFDYPSSASSPGLARGATVQGKYYVSSDAVDQCSFHFALDVGNASVGGVDTGPQTIDGGGGATFVPIPFTFRLANPVAAGAGLTFTAQANCVESVFVGYSGDHHSQFTAG